MSDGNGGTDTGTVMITVAPVADAPDVTGVDLTVPEADAEQTLYPDVTAEVTDTDGSETLVELRASA